MDRDTSVLFTELSVGKVVEVNIESNAYYFTITQHTECFPPCVTAKYIRSHETESINCAVEKFSEIETINVVDPISRRHLATCYFEMEHGDSFLLNLYSSEEETEEESDIVRILYKGRLVTVVCGGRELGIFTSRGTIPGPDGPNVELHLLAYLGNHTSRIDIFNSLHSTDGVIQISDAFDSRTRFLDGKRLIVDLQSLHRGRESSITVQCCFAIDQNTSVSDMKDPSYDRLHIG
jgi:hypothetical protein